MNAVTYPSEKIRGWSLPFEVCIFPCNYGWNHSLSKSSFDKDGHESAIIENPSCCVTPDVLNRLQLDVLKLVCEVTCKYQSVRKSTSSEENKCNCATQCDCSTNGSPKCDVDWDDQSTDSSCTSTSSEPSVSCNSDSTYHVAYEDDDEHDNSEDMYYK